MMAAGVTIFDRDSRGVLAFDLRDILEALGEALAGSRWLCRNVECVNGPELEATSDWRRELDTPELIRMAAQVGQTIEGDFEARRPGESTPWLRIGAIDSTFFEVLTREPQILTNLRSRFRDVRDAESEVWPGS